MTWVNLWEEGNQRVMPTMTVKVCWHSWFWEHTAGISYMSETRKQSQRDARNPWDAYPHPFLLAQDPGPWDGITHIRVTVFACWLILSESSPQRHSEVCLWGDFKFTVSVTFTFPLAIPTASCLLCLSLSSLHILYKTLALLLCLPRPHFPPALQTFLFVS